MKILLTGATGFLGNNLLRRLIELGHELTVIVRTSSDLRSLDGLAVERVYGDLSASPIVNDLPLKQLVSTVDIVIHSAAMIQLGWKKLEVSLAVNRDATSDLAAACLANHKRMIHVSTVDALAAAAYPEQTCNESNLDPLKSECTYSRSKRAGDDAFLKCVQEGLDGVIVHPGFMLGPYDWKPSSGEMILAIAKQRIPFAPGGGFSVTDVRDVCDGIVSAITHARAGERYILAGENMTYFDLWCRIARIVGGKPPFRPMKNWLAKTVGFAGDCWTRLSGKETNVNSAALQMGQMFHYYTSEKAESELGYRIGSVEDAISDAWNWFQANGYR